MTIVSASDRVSRSPRTFAARARQRASLGWLCVSLAMAASVAHAVARVRCSVCTVPATKHQLANRVSRLRSPDSGTAG
jgi:hypothetical protein